jgi:CheY-like chemotaxis protein
MPSLKILIVDDEPTILAFLQTLIESFGYNVRTAVCNSLETAHEIVQTARSQRFNIAIIGTVMPGLHGMELAERINRVAPTTKLVLAIEDACVECTRVLRTKGIGAESLPAPFDHEDLRLLLSSLAEPPSQAMALSFWILAAISMFVGVFVYLSLSASIVLRATASIMAFLVSLHLLGIVSTYTLARVYGIKIEGNPHLDRRRKLRGEIERLMDSLHMDEGKRATVRNSLIFGSSNEQEVVLELKEKITGAKPVD